MTRAIYIAPIFLAIAASSAGADDVENALEILQEFSGTQTGLNSVIATVDGEGEGDVGTITVDVDQFVTNAANILLGGDTAVADATQISLGQQVASNTLDAGNALLSAGNHVQLGENLANVIVADRVDRVTQQFGPGALQTVENVASLLDLADSAFTQTGRNTANLVFADVSIGGGEQQFPSNTTQTINNLLTIGSGGLVEDGSPTELSTPSEFAEATPARVSEGYAIVQEGTNIGNVLIADEVINVHREFSGEQIVLNHLILPDAESDGVLSTAVMQSGVNIANFVSASRVDGLTQTSEGVQIVDNRVTTPSLADLTGELTNYTAVSENFVNVLHIRAPSEGEGFDAESLAGSTIRVTQLADVPQTSSQSGGGQTQVGNAAVVER